VGGVWLSILGGPSLAELPGVASGIWAPSLLDRDDEEAQGRASYRVPWAFPEWASSFGEIVRPETDLEAVVGHWLDGCCCCR